MPELPEVESIRLGLSKYLIGHTLIDIAVHFDKAFSGNKKNIIDAAITSVRRFAKVLSIDFYNHYSLLIHVKMTGQLIYEGPNLSRHKSLSSKISPLGGKHTRVVFSLDRGGKLYFNDTRKFGWIKVVKSSEINNSGFISRLGPEPMGGLTFNIFKQLISSARTPVKSVLMNQEKIGGIGNIYANDALWLSKIHPKRPGVSLTASEQQRLYQAINEVITRALKLGGASEQSFVHPDGSEGEYQEHFLVYGQNGQPCSRCRTQIVKYQQAGRGTYYCTNCQRL